VIRMSQGSSGKEKNHGPHDATIIAAWIGGGAVVLAALIAGAFTLIPHGGESVATPTTRPSSVKAPTGVITVPLDGTNDVLSKHYLHASGTAQNIPPGYRLDLFYQIDGYDRFYAANPNNSLTLKNGRWFGSIYIGVARPSTLWLVDLSPRAVDIMNSEKYDQSNGYPSIRKLGTVLASEHFTVK
jgi:hypothetical protein